MCNSKKICKNYVNGNCKYGSACKFLHEDPQEDNDDLESSDQESEDKSDQGYEGEKVVCKNYPNCKYGSSCKFYHPTD